MPQTILVFLASSMEFDFCLILQVIIVPHSHNDPGWLKTFEQYFYYESKDILNNMVKKLNQYPNMTFIWSEISFLSMWWEQAHPTKRKALKRFVDEGRLEITTGGWVMTDEATTHLYAMVDQLVEGKIQFLFQNFCLFGKLRGSVARRMPSSIHYVVCFLFYKTQERCNSVFRAGKYVNGWDAIKIIQKH